MEGGPWLLCILPGAGGHCWEQDRSQRGLCPSCGEREAPHSRCELFSAQSRRGSTSSHLLSCQRLLDWDTLPFCLPRIQALPFARVRRRLLEKTDLFDGCRVRCGPCLRNTDVKLLRERLSCAQPYTLHNMCSIAARCDIYRPSASLPAGLQIWDLETPKQVEHKGYIYVAVIVVMQHIVRHEVKKS